MKRHFFYLAAAATGMFLGTAQAASVSFFLDQSNELPDGTNYLKVTISDGAAGDIDFMVETTDAFEPGPNFGIQKFGFNGPTLDESNISGLPDDWTFGNFNNMSEFGIFVNTESGTGSSRQDPLAFSIVGIDGDVPTDYATGDPFFVAHVADFTNYGDIDSAFFAGSTEIVPPTEIPLPAAVWLLGSGLMGLVGVARKRA